LITKIKINMQKKDLEAPDVDIIKIINTGIKIADATIPWINEMIAKIKAGNERNINTPAGKKARILANDALDKLQEQKIELLDKQQYGIIKYIKKCQETGALPTFPDFPL
jgi:hypothetical protein